VTIITTFEFYEVSDGELLLQYTKQHCLEIETKNSL